MTPSVGKAVHYVARGSADGVFQPACRAAIITAIQTSKFSEVMQDSWTVSLFVMNPNGVFLNEYCEYHGGDPASEPEDEQTGLSYEGGTWHWLERVE